MPEGWTVSVIPLLARTTCGNRVPTDSYTGSFIVTSEMPVHVGQKKKHDGTCITQPNTLQFITILEVQETCVCGIWRTGKVTVKAVCVFIR